MPIVSVVMPTHNRMHFLAQAIKSVQAQTLTDWELIVVDDGSTDDTPQLLECYAAADGRIRFIRQTQQGQFAAMNTGLREIRGEYVAFLDDDDLWLPHKLQVQLEDLRRHPEYAFTYCLMRVRGPHGETGATKPARRGTDTFEELLQRNFVPMSAMVRRCCLEAVGGGFDGALQRAGDYDLWLRLALRSPFGSAEEPLAVFRFHGANKTAIKSSLHYACHVRIFQHLLADDQLTAQARRIAAQRLSREQRLLARACAKERRWGRAFFAMAEATLT
jgi:glycosyltransferase involved in cell wall biosynthesis